MVQTVEIKQSESNCHWSLIGIQFESIVLLVKSCNHLVHRTVYSSCDLLCDKCNVDCIVLFFIYYLNTNCYFLIFSVLRYWHSNTYNIFLIYFIYLLAPVCVRYTR